MLLAAGVSQRRCCCCRVAEALVVRCRGFRRPSWSRRDSHGRRWNCRRSRRRCVARTAAVSEAEVADCRGFRGQRFAVAVVAAAHVAPAIAGSCCRFRCCRCRIVAAAQVGVAVVPLPALSAPPVSADPGCPSPAGPAPICSRRQLRGHRRRPAVVADHGGHVPGPHLLVRGLGGRDRRRVEPEQVRPSPANQLSSIGRHRRRMHRRRHRRLERRGGRPA